MGEVITKSTSLPKILARVKGQVYKSTGSWYQVKAENGEFWSCRIKGKLRLKGIKSTNPVSVGDWVDFDRDEKGQENEGVITDIRDRHNYLIRKSTNLSKQTHVIAANLDQLFLIITVANPTTSYGFIDRFLVMAEAFNVPVSLVINKMDSYSDEEMEKVLEMVELYRSVGYTVLACSAETGENMEEISEAMKGKTVAFSGHSGVGKSSILKRVAPDLEIKIGDTSSVHQKGKHTTTFAEMFDLEGDKRIIDTPGIKGFGLTQVEKDEIALYFREMKNKLEDCRFYNCKHLNEPGCAVKEAVEEGEIAYTRYESYFNMMHDDESSYRSNIYG